MPSRTLRVATQSPPACWAAPAPRSIIFTECRIPISSRPKPPTALPPRGLPRLPRRLHPQLLPHLQRHRADGLTTETAKREPIARKGGWLPPVLGRQSGYKPGYVGSRVSAPEGSDLAGRFVIYLCRVLPQRLIGGAARAPVAVYPPATGEQPLNAGLLDLATPKTCGIPGRTGTRWALTPPFHPYRLLCSVEGRSRRLFSVTLSLRSPTAFR